MKQSTLLLIITITVCMTSCTSQFMTSSLQPESIREVTLINPVSFIEYIAKGEGNRMTYNDSLSMIANKNVEDGIVGYLSNQFRVNTVEFDSATNKLVKYQIYEMMERIQMDREIEFIEIPSSLDSVMVINNIEYAVVAIHAGFGREKGNFGTQVAKGVLLGVATLGTVYTVPVKSVSDLTICIIDRNNNNIAFHNRSVFQDYDPTNKGDTNIQIQNIFEEYFYKLN